MVNGYIMRQHDGGYTPFSIDITDFLNTDAQPNVIAVRVDADGCDVAAGGIELVGKLHTRLLQAEILHILVVLCEDVDVVGHIIAVGEDEAVASLQRLRGDIEHQAALIDCDRRRLHGGRE